jgi:hypothetical protein
MSTMRKERGGHKEEGTRWAQRGRNEVGTKRKERGGHKEEGTRWAQRGWEREEHLEDGKEMKT